MGWEHHEELQKHESQKDYSKGFGGKYGVQTDRKDKVHTITITNRREFFFIVKLIHNVIE